MTGVQTCALPIWQSNMEPRFGRVITAMITPFTADGALDLDGAVDLASWLVEQGNDGLVLAGTTGESPTLTHDEQIDLVEAVSEAVDCHVIAGAGSNDTAAAMELTRRDRKSVGSGKSEDRGGRGCLKRKNCNRKYRD